MKMPQDKNPTILAIDQGTTSSRAILFSRDGDILESHQKELTLHYPHKGWVEQNAEDIWRDTLWACREIIKNDTAHTIAGIGITNQRETTIIWDRDTGEPVYNAIVWQDRRAAQYCQQLIDQGLEATVTSKTGLLLDPYFSATKIKWVLDNVQGARDKAQAGKLAFGTVDSFLLWRLTDGKVHATDATNAARTMIYNIVEGAWDDELLTLFDIPKSLLPNVRDNVSDFGVSAEKILGRALMIGGMAGDQQAATIGQACFEAGMVKSTYGTGCFMLMNIGDDFKVSKNRLLTTIAYQLNGKPTYAIEGAIFVAGAAVQWLRDNLGLFDDAVQTAEMARSVADNNEVYFVPAFTGLGAPYWKPEAKAAIIGLSRESTKAHVVRAALEAQAYQTLDLMEAFVKDSGFDPKLIRVDGGLVANDFVCQFLADMINRPVDLPKVIETTALGASYLAGLQLGLYKDIDDIAARWSKANSYFPEMDDAQRDLLYGQWKHAVARILL